MVNSSYNVIGANLLEAPGHEKLDFILKNGYYSKDLTDGLAQMGYMAKGFQYKTPTILNPPNYMNCPIMFFPCMQITAFFLVLSPFTLLKASQLPLSLSFSPICQNDPLRII